MSSLNESWLIFLSAGIFSLDLKGDSLLFNDITIQPAHHMTMGVFTCIFFPLFFAYKSNADLVFVNYHPYR